MKEYKRLTVKVPSGYRNENNWHCDYFMPTNIVDVIERLGEFEDDIESGEFVRLPCDVGDTVYLCEKDLFFDKRPAIQTAKVMEIQRWSKSDWWFKVDLYNGDTTKLYHLLCLSLFGKTWFVSEEQAEKKLQELIAECAQ